MRSLPGTVDRVPSEQGKVESPAGGGYRGPWMGDVSVWWQGYSAIIMIIIIIIPPEYHSTESRNSLRSLGKTVISCGCSELEQGWRWRIP